MQFARDSGKGGTYLILRNSQSWQPNYIDQFHRGIIPEEKRKPGFRAGLLK